ARRLAAGQRARDAADEAAEARYQAEYGDLPRTIHVAPPTVALTLRIENPTGHPVSLRTDGDSTTLRMLLRGPGAHHALGGGDTSEIFRVGRLATIPAHGHLDIPIRTLEYGDRAHEIAAYWTQPGNYTLEVAFDTVVDAGGGSDPSIPVRLRAAPVTLRVR
ncbi:MAG: hypothetical protein KC619_35850, partial [Myxococcales bacterium]|nr:hypothetical protein [Myxococcales bacterium]